MLNDAELDKFCDLVKYIHMFGSKKCDIWTSKDLHYVILFHVSNDDMTTDMSPYIRMSVLYPEHMMLDMWNPANWFARKHIVNCNALCCPILYAPLPIHGDSWCNCRGGEAYIYYDSLDEGYVKAMYVKPIGFNVKELLLDKLLENNFIRLCDAKPEIIDEQIMGFRIENKLSTYTMRSLYTHIKYMQLFRHRVSSDVLFQKLRFISDNMRSSWKYPIYVDRSFDNLLCVSNENNIDTCMYNYSMKEWKLLSLTTGELCDCDITDLDQFIILQCVSWFDLVLGLTSDYSITVTTKLYKQTYDKIKWYCMQRILCNEVSE